MSEKLITIKDADINKILGSNNSKFNKIKRFFPQIKLISRGDKIKVVGSLKEISHFESKFNLFIDHLDKFNSLTINQIERIIDGKENILNGENDVILHGKNGNLIKAKTFNQRKMLAEIDKNDVVFAIGPAGTGKTFLATVCAARLLNEKKIEKIVLTRPAVEAGESLGFLPGDLQQKVDPYLRPLFDSLHSIFGFDRTNSLIDKGIIEVAPLAFMRGRTLDNSMVILDEAQNTTCSQMRMFLTRLGDRSKMVVNGDITQIDLKKDQESGLIEASRIFSETEGIKFCYLNIEDVVRHPLVQKIIEAYQ